MPMPGNPKAEILENPFISKLRTEMVVDREAFQALCRSLMELEKEWKNTQFIDKELAQELYILAPVSKNMADSLVKHRPDLAAQITEMAIELDALVLNCFSS